MKTNPLKSLDINLASIGTVNALHCSDNVNTMCNAPAPRRMRGEEAKMEKTSKLIRVEGLVGLALEALRAIRKLEIAWNSTMHRETLYHVGYRARRA